MGDDPIVELMAVAVSNAINTDDFGWNAMTDFGKETYRDHARAILTALSERGLKVLPVEATEEIAQGMGTGKGEGATAIARQYWRQGAAAFDPSQLEAKDEGLVVDA